jgi:O-antigen/teichoic acid export membrane protein
MLKVFLKDTGKYLALKVLISLSWILSLHLFTRYLGAAAYGNYSVLFSLTSYGVILSSSWLVSSALRFASVDERDGMRLRESVFGLLWGSQGAFAPIFLVTILLLSRAGWIETTWMDAVLLTLLVALTSLLQTAFAFQRARRAILSYGRDYGAQVIGGILLSWVLLRFWKPAVTSIWLGMIGGACIGACLVRREIHWRARVRGHRATPILRAYGLPVIGINLFTQLLSSADQILLKFFGHHTEVGVYAASYGLAQNTVFAFSSLVGSALTPLLFQTWERGEREAALQLLRRVVGGFAAVTLPVVIIASAFRHEVVNLLFRPEFSAGAAVIPAVTLGAFFVGVSNVFSELLTLEKDTRSLLACYAIAAAVNVCANCIFIPRAGMYGAAWVTLGSYALLSASIVGVFISRMRKRALLSSR